MDIENQEHEVVATANGSQIVLINTSRCYLFSVKLFEQITTYTLFLCISIVLLLLALYTYTYLT